MSNDVLGTALSRGEYWRLGLRTAGQLVVSLVALGALYFLVPTQDVDEGSDVPWLLLELGLFAMVVAVQIPAIVTAKYPILRAVISLGIVVPLYLLVFARLYLSRSLSDPAAFTELLDHVSALYFTVTVFATVGFGDIVPRTDGTRLLVTAQMLLNLVVAGTVIRLFVLTAKRGRERKAVGSDGQP